MGGNWQGDFSRTGQNIEIGSHVFDLSGINVGSVRGLFGDPATGKPRWAIVATGSTDRVVPVADADLRGERIRLFIQRQVIANSPTFKGELTGDDESRLARYYGIEWERDEDRPSELLTAGPPAGPPAGGGRRPPPTASPADADGEDDEESLGHP